MRPLLRFFTRNNIFRASSRPQAPPRKIVATTMATTSTVTAAIYAATFEAPVDADGAPEEARKHSHHNPNGKGFINPWESWGAVSPMAIGKEMIM